MRIERYSVLNALNFKKILKKPHNCAFLWDFLALSWFYQYKIQIPVFFQFLMIIFSHNNQQLETMTVIVVICFSH